jgi:hypothetical protein
MSQRMDYTARLLNIRLHCSEGMQTLKRRIKISSDLLVTVRGAGDGLRRGEIAC